MALGKNQIIYNSDVTSENKGSTIVYRDGSKNFSANQVNVEYCQANTVASPQLMANNGIYLQVQDDGNGVVYNTSGNRIWAASYVSSYLVKDNIQSLTSTDLTNFDKLRPVSFYYKPEMNLADTDKQYGLIAEEVLQLYPNLVNIPSNYDESKFDVNKGTHQPLISIKYMQFVPLLIKKIQMQQEKLQELRKILQNKLNT